LTQNLNGYVVTGSGALSNLTASYAITAAFALNGGGGGPTSVGPIFTASAMLFTGSNNNANIRLVVESTGDVDTAATSLLKVEPTIGSILMEIFTNDVIRMGQAGANALVVTGSLFYGTGSVYGTAYSIVTSSAATNITLSLADSGKYFRTTAATAVGVQVRTQANIPWPDNAEIMFEQAGAGQITLAGEAGVTINSSETLKTLKQYSVVGLKRVASNTWTLNGERQLL
jgi:hypothetical protein